MKGSRIVEVVRSAKGRRNSEVEMLVWPLGAAVDTASLRGKQCCQLASLEFALS